MKQQEEPRNEIIKVYKDLKSTDEDTYDTAYNHLVEMFYEEEDIDGLDDVTFIDQFNIIQSITFAILKGSIELEDYDMVVLIIKEYEIIKEQVANNIYDEEDLLIFKLSNEFFEQQLDKILHE